MFDEFPACDHCGNDNPLDGLLCGVCRVKFDVRITDGDAQYRDLHAERMAILFRDAEADDYEANCTLLTPAQQRAKELIEAELMPLAATAPQYAEGSW